MKKIKLSKKEKAIEKALVGGEYGLVDMMEMKKIAQAIARRKKDAVLNIRVNSEDLRSIKHKAGQLGVPYQTFVSEMLHHFAA